MKKSTRWALIVALVAATGVAMVLAFLLSIATDNRLFYEKHFQWLFWVNLLVAGLLMLVIGIAATRLLVRVQRGKFGSRLLLKLAAIFALVGVLPGVLIYTVSYQFVSRGIETFLACSTTRRRREFMSGSAPLRAATIKSFDSLPKARPRAFAARSLCLAFHCAPIFSSP